MFAEEMSLHEDICNLADKISTEYLLGYKPDHFLVNRYFDMTEETKTIEENIEWYKSIKIGHLPIINRDRYPTEEYMEEVNNRLRLFKLYAKMAKKFEQFGKTNPFGTPVENEQ